MTAGYKGKYVMEVGEDPWKCCDCHSDLEKQRPPEKEGESNACTVCKTVFTAQFLDSAGPLSFMKAFGVAGVDATRALCWWMPDRVEKEAKPHWMN